MKLKDRIKDLPAELRTVANKFDIKRPSKEVPAFMMDSMMKTMSGEKKDDFSIEMAENELFDVAEFAFKSQGRELPDTIPNCENYFDKVIEFASIINLKIFGFEYESGELKPCELYQNNEKVSVVGIRDRKKLNDACVDLDSPTDKGLEYATHFGIAEEYNALSEWDKRLFYQYCYANKASNTKVGKS